MLEDVSIFMAPSVDDRRRPSATRRPAKRNPSAVAIRPIKKHLIRWPRFFLGGGGSFFLFYDSESFYEITVFLFQSIDHHQYYVSKHVCVVFGKSTQKWNDELDSINEIEYKVSFVRMILFSIRMECAHCKFYLVLLGFT